MWPEHFHVQTRISLTLFAMPLMVLDGTREDTVRRSPFALLFCVPTGKHGLLQSPGPQNPYFLLPAPLMTTRPAPKISEKETQPKAERNHFFGMRVLSQPQQS